MKTRNLYLIIFVLAVIVIINLIYSRNKISELNLPSAKEVQVETRQSEITVESTAPIFFQKQAITIVKPAKKRENVTSGIDDIQEFKKKQKLGSSEQSTFVSNSGGNSQDSELSAGVTLSGKYPTQEETKEMNSKGIVMY